MEPKKRSQTSKSRSQSKSSSLIFHSGTICDFARNKIVDDLKYEINGSKLYVHDILSGDYRFISAYVSESSSIEDNVKLLLDYLNDNVTRFLLVIDGKNVYLVGGYYVDFDVSYNSLRDMYLDSIVLGKENELVEKFLSSTYLGYSLYICHGDSDLIFDLVRLSEVV